MNNRGSIELGIFDLQITNNQILKIRNSADSVLIPKFKYPFSGSQFKIYLLTDHENVLYIGTTKNSIKNRLRYGLLASGKNGYHGYKWKSQPTIKLHVWCFEGLDKEKIENIEAEFVYLIRKETGKWPIYQNEIHFNNLFDNQGEKIAESLYKQIQYI